MRAKNYLVLLTVPEAMLIIRALRQARGWPHAIALADRLTKHYVRRMRVRRGAREVAP